MSDPIDLDDVKRRMEASFDNMKKEFSGLRTGRASTSLLEGITVEAYGAQMPVHQVANLSVPEPQMLTVQVWDANLTKNVEKAIRDSGLGLNPQAEGTLIRVPVPPMTEERRKEMVKVGGKYAEQARIAVRNTRRNAMDQLKKAEKEGDISEDEHRRLSDQVQKLTDEVVGKIDEALEQKEKDIMQV